VRGTDHKAPNYAITICLVPLGPIIFFSGTFSDTISQCFSISMRDRFSHPYKRTDKIIFVYMLIFIYLPLISQLIAVV